MRSRASAGCAGAHELGQTAQTSLRYRHRPLPELRRQLKDHRRHRRSAGDCQNPYSSGPADPRPAARPGAASRFIPDNLRAENRLPTQADGAARSEFERKRTQWALTKEEMKNCVWLKPELVAQIEFTEWTPDGHLRHSKFVGLREDKEARDVVRER
jgi:ATP dependent DNA ligase C terminal region